MREYTENIDSAAARAARKNQGDPLIQYFVLDYKNISGSLSDILVSAARAAVLSEASLYESHSEAFDTWWDESFRKVVLKAKPAEFKRLDPEEEFSVRHDDFRVFAPVRKSERAEIFGAEQDRWMKKLQVLTDLDIEAGVPCAADLNIFVLDSMSLGKACAQVAHGFMKYGVEHGISADELLKATLAIHWVPEIVIPSEDTQFSVVADAGLTEVAPGTQTVLIA